MNRRESMTNTNDPQKKFTDQQTYTSMKYTKQQQPQQSKEKAQNVALLIVARPVLLLT